MFVVVRNTKSAQNNLVSSQININFILVFNRIINSAVEMSLSLEELNLMSKIIEPNFVETAAKRSLKVIKAQ